METKNSCSKHFKFDDFYFCSETWQDSPTENVPEREETLSAISELATYILDKVVDQFGPIGITYGFCSSNLTNLIKKNDHIQDAGCCFGRENERWLNGILGKVDR